MFIEIVILIQVMVLFTFAFAYFTKQEVLWCLTIVLSGILMVSSYNVEYHTSFDTIPFTVQSYSLPYLALINLLFMLLSLTLFFVDLFEKYGIEIIYKIFKRKEKVYK